jgi:hypothetical protein
MEVMTRIEDTPSWPALAAAVAAHKAAIEQYGAKSQEAADAGIRRFRAADKCRKEAGISAL